MYIFILIVLDKIHIIIASANRKNEKHEFYTLYFKIYNKVKDI